MTFPRTIREDALIQCQRFCCICHKFCGLKMECHHIVQPGDGGDDSFDNCIPLCLDCHVDVKAYNPNHLKGTAYTESELRRHRDQWYNFCANNHISRDAVQHSTTTTTSINAQLQNDRLKARNFLIKFVDFCVRYPTTHKARTFDRTLKLVSETGRIKDAIEMLGPLSMPEFPQKYASVIAGAWNLQRLLDRQGQGGPSPKPIDSRFVSVEDNIDGIINELSETRQTIKETVDPYLSIGETYNKLDAGYGK